tara:strand:- start:2857 stop:3093 length:237 start_codon:yes stop_codon:yes gene_type:complete
MFWLTRQQRASKLFRRLWLLLILLVLAFAAYILYRWLWLGEDLPPHFSVARALFLAFLVLLLGARMLWRKRRRRPPGN